MGLRHPVCILLILSRLSLYALKILLHAFSVCVLKISLHTVSVSVFKNPSQIFGHTFMDLCSAYIFMNVLTTYTHTHTHSYNIHTYKYTHAPIGTYKIL